LSKVAGFVLGGTNLHGKNAVNNLSLSGWGEFQHHPTLALAAAAAVAVAGIFALVRWAQSGPSGAGAAQVGTVVLLSVFLAGRISEVHFLLTVMATTMLALLLRPSRRAALLVLPAFLLLVLPHEVFGGLARPGANLQTCYVLAELMLLGAGLRAALTRR
jgi:hypothetical protein